ncbi:MAG: sodium/pantothenate symporter, partial [Fusobacteriaceae bacterium]
MTLRMLPIILYLLIMIFIAWKISKVTSKKNINFIEEYFMGSRGMNGIVLSMTLIGAYVGASSFIGGPAFAYKLGLGWVLLACIQYPTAFFTLGILGKKLAIVSRKIGSVTISDFLRARYQNELLVFICSVALVIFTIGAITVQFIGGARLFESVLGVPYYIGLGVFTLFVIAFTAIGGFRAVVVTDAIQGFVMLVATILLFVSVLKFGGGMENITKKIMEINPELLTPTSGGNISKPFILSFWMLVGVALLGLPSTTVNCMGFKNTKSLHSAMIIGTAVVGILMLGMHLIGFMGIAILPAGKISDTVVPVLALTTLHPILAGVFIAGPLAAIMSTIDSLLIQSSATIIKD